MTILWCCLLLGVLSATNSNPASAGGSADGVPQSSSTDTAGESSRLLSDKYEKLPARAMVARSGNNEESAQSAVEALAKGEDGPKGGDSKPMGRSIGGPRPRPIPAKTPSRSCSNPKVDPLITRRDPEPERKSDPVDAKDLAERLLSMQAEMEKMKREMQAVKQSEIKMASSIKKMKTPRTPKGSSLAPSASPQKRDMKSSGAESLNLGSLLDKPGVKAVRVNPALDKNGNVFYVSHVVKETPRGPKTTRYIGTAPPGLVSSAGLPAKSGTSMLSAQPSGNLASTSSPPAVLPGWQRPSGGSPPMSSSGIALLVTEEMPFPHYPQCQVAPYSKGDLPPTPPPSLSESSKEMKSSGGATGRKMSVPQTFRMVAERTGLRREASRKGGKGFLHSGEGAGATGGEEPAAEAAEDDGGKPPKGRKGRRSGHRSKSKEKKPEPSLIHEGATGGGGAGAGGDQEGGQEVEDDHIAIDVDVPETRTKHKSTELPSDLTPDPSMAVPPVSDESEEDPASHRKVMIFDDDEPSEEDSEPHTVCMDLQPYIRNVEQEIFFHMSSTMGMLFALILRLIAQLGGF